MLASKGSDDSSMWQKITRGLDKIISLTKSINLSLNMHKENSERKTFVGTRDFYLESSALEITVFEIL